MLKPHPAPNQLETWKKTSNGTVPCSYHLNPAVPFVWPLWPGGVLVVAIEGIYPAYQARLRDQSEGQLIPIKKRGSPEPRAQGSQGKTQAQVQPHCPAVHEGTARGGRRAVQKPSRYSFQLPECPISRRLRIVGQYQGWTQESL